MPPRSRTPSRSAQSNPSDKSPSPINPNVNSSARQSMALVYEQGLKDSKDALHITESSISHHRKIVYITGAVNVALGSLAAKTLVIYSATAGTHAAAVASSFRAKNIVKSSMINMLHSYSSIIASLGIPAVTVTTITDYLNLHNVDPLISEHFATLPPHAIDGLVDILNHYLHIFTRSNLDEAIRSMEVEVDRVFDIAIQKKNDVSNSVLSLAPLSSLVTNSDDTFEENIGMYYFFLLSAILIGFIIFLVIGGVSYHKKGNLEEVKTEHKYAIERFKTVLLVKSEELEYREASERANSYVPLSKTLSSSWADNLAKLITKLSGRSKPVMSENDIKFAKESLRNAFSEE